MKKRLGLIVRNDHSGLGYQTRALEHLLKPDRIIVIGKDEIPSFLEYHDFLKDIDVMLTCETPYTYEAWNWAKIAGVKTFCQPNWELFDGLVQPNMPHPDQYLMPSYWHLEDMQKLFPNTIYLPPPTLDLPKARKTNLSRTGKRRFVHIVGTPAIYDRNGWSQIMDCLSQTKSDFELVVYAQQEITGIRDPRVTYNIFDVESQEDLYTDFDALIMPRRYGGLCLPMNEALMAGLPVIMSDISPNNKILPKKWLLPAQVTAQFEGRSVIDVYSVSELAEKIDWLCSLPDYKLRSEKQQAYKIAQANYSEKALLPKYKSILFE